MGGLPCRNRKASTATTPNKALLISHLESHTTEARHDKYGRTLSHLSVGGACEGPAREELRSWLVCLDEAAQHGRGVVP